MINCAYNLGIACDACMHGYIAVVTVYNLTIAHSNNILDGVGSYFIFSTGARVS